ncbi:hypothetical protein O9G_000629 [Rozella allomycis CSF55]|uniref:Uncharacterized protein n=1 Tax=Rozella allomycis (strain CSF55) TaxID=988480 RepID=A0A075B361_ROZAC|nr:hypothetical protein O9G_000629 [Rozella allomycis CSF55]|eukprot:EPZ35233.1 hypothetical protein O9G_000629 [Rozella allomycis CSF55]
MNLKVFLCLLVLIVTLSANPIDPQNNISADAEVIDNKVPDEQNEKMSVWGKVGFVLSNIAHGFFHGKPDDGLNKLDGDSDDHTAVNIPDDNVSVNENKVVEPKGFEVLDMQDLTRQKVPEETEQVLAVEETKVAKENVEIQQQVLAVEETEVAKENLEIQQSNIDETKKETQAPIDNDKEKTESDSKASADGGNEIPIIAIVSGVFGGSAVASMAFLARRKYAKSRKDQINNA